MINLSPRKRKLNKATLKEEESTIAIDFEEETKESVFELCKQPKSSLEIEDVRPLLDIPGYDMVDKYML